MNGGVPLQGCVGNTWLDTSRQLVLVNAQHRSEVPAVVDDDARTDRIAGDRCSGASTGDGDFVITTSPHDRFDFIRRSRECHPCRHETVDGGI
jgi:hypothetical protein